MASRVRLALRILRADVDDEDYGAPDIHDGLLAELTTCVDKKIAGTYTPGQNEMPIVDNTIDIDWSPLGTFGFAIFHNRSAYNVSIRYDSVLGSFTEYQTLLPGEVCILTSQYSGAGAAKMFRMTGGAFGSILSEVDVWIFGS
jgi:hypothetical protein